MTKCVRGLTCLALEAIIYLVSWRELIFHVYAIWHQYTVNGVSMGFRMAFREYEIHALSHAVILTKRKICSKFNRIVDG